jgi:ABC-type glycerol-3-phosphate transport system substrate-binding protein
MHKLIFAAIALGVLLGGCAGAPSASSGDGGSITMYGTIDEGISVRK